ncbi:MAG: transposase [Candidatus Kuenenia sp.]|nr:transposase [Candidatus Kuenenia hertensis]
MTLYKNKYRTGSVRLTEWDYSTEGHYFVTICTLHGECVFGEVIEEQVHLSSIGKIVAEEWVKTEIIRNNVLLDKWIVMPNHLHGIIIIKNNDVETHCCASPNVTLHGNAINGKPHGNATTETHGNASLPPYKNKFGPQRNYLSSIIRGFKSATTGRIRIIKRNFSWQERFYDHIIRNEKSLNKIREYILNNPLKWESDKNNLENLFM